MADKRTRYPHYSADEVIVVVRDYLLSLVVSDQAVDKNKALKEATAIQPKKYCARHIGKNVWRLSPRGRRKGAGQWLFSENEQWIKPGDDRAAAFLMVLGPGPFQPGETPGNRSMP